MSFTVAIVGRPNVGKSTLFNRLVGRRLALVDDKPGVTRDRREGEARLGDIEFTVIDTAGLEESAAESLSGRMRAQTETAIVQADAIFFMIDARAGPSARAMERFLKPTMPFRATRISLLCSGHLFDSLVSAVPPYRWGPGEGGVRSERRGMAVSRFSTCETKLMA